MDFESNKVSHTEQIELQYHYQKAKLWSV
jgi:hypothetical protein